MLALKVIAFKRRLNPDLATFHDIACDAAAAAAARRFRPIVLTTLTTALGLAPLLFETSPQAQFLIPMGVSLGFGIVVSGFMVIFVTPAVAVILEDVKRFRPFADSAVEPVKETAESGA